MFGGWAVSDLTAPVVQWLAGRATALAWLADDCFMRSPGLANLAQGLIHGMSCAKQLSWSAEQLDVWNRTVWECC